jgi:hypothetical protein
MMSQSKPATSADALISVLRAALGGDGPVAFGHLVLYTSFGVVRGRTGLAFAQELVNKENGGGSLQEVIELCEVTVEHYSNHLPTASFDRLYVRLADVNGFALVNPLGQG